LQHLDRSMAIIETSTNELMLIYAQVLAFEKHLHAGPTVVDSETSHPVPP
jgi:hypothetical protein